MKQRDVRPLILGLFFLIGLLAISAYSDSEGVSDADFGQSRGGACFRSSFILGEERGQW